MPPENQPAREPESAPESAPAAPRRKRRIGRYALLVLFAAGAYFGWREYVFRQALPETEAAGIYWFYDDPLDAIKADWRAVFRAGTWNGKRTLVALGNPGVDAIRTRNLVARLRPKLFSVSYCDNFEAIGEFKGVGGVRRFEASECLSLKNLEALRGSTSLEEVYLTRCQCLQNLDILKSLPKLRVVGIHSCDGLPTGAFGALKAALPGVQVTDEFPAFSP